MSSIYFKTLSCTLRNMDFTEFCRLAGLEDKTPQAKLEELVRAYITASEEKEKNGG